MIQYDDIITHELFFKLKHCADVIDFVKGTVKNTKDVFWHHSCNNGLLIVAKFSSCTLYTDCDVIDLDLTTGKVYYDNEYASELAPSVKHILDWYKSKVNGGEIMSKKEINEAIRDDIQKLASDLTKKREMDKANSSAEDIAKKLGVKLPKSKKQL